MNRSVYSTKKKTDWVNSKRSRTKSIADICNEAGICRKTLHNWEKEIPKAPKSTTQSKTNGLKSEKLNEKTINRMIITSINKISDLAFKKKLIQRMVKNYTITVQHACKIVELNFEEYNYKPRKIEVDDIDVKIALGELMAKNKVHSFEKCYALIKKAHATFTRKQVYRVYRENKAYLSKCSQIGKDNTPFYEEIRDH